MVSNVDQVKCVIKGCDRDPVVLILCRVPPLELPVCKIHPASVIWGLREKYPGHGGISTKSMRGTL